MVRCVYESVCRVHMELKSLFCLFTRNIALICSMYPRCICISHISIHIPLLYSRKSCFRCRYMYIRSNEKNGLGNIKQFVCYIKRMFSLPSSKQIWGTDLTYCVKSSHIDVIWMIPKNRWLGSQRYPLLNLSLKTTHNIVMHIQASCNKCLFSPRSIYRTSSPKGNDRSPESNVPTSFHFKQASK